MANLEDIKLEDLESEKPGGEMPALMDVEISDEQAKMLEGIDPKVLAKFLMTTGNYEVKEVMEASSEEGDMEAETPEDGDVDFGDLSGLI